MYAFHLSPTEEKYLCGLCLVSSRELIIKTVGISGVQFNLGQQRHTLISNTSKEVKH